MHFLFSFLSLHFHYHELSNYFCAKNLNIAWEPSHNLKKKNKSFCPQISDSEVFIVELQSEE